MKEFKETIETINELEDKRRTLAQELNEVSDELFDAQFALERKVMDKYLPVDKLKEALPWLNDESIKGWKGGDSIRIRYAYKVGNADETFRLQMGIHVTPGYDDVELSYRIDGTHTCVELKDDSMESVEQKIQSHLEIVNNAYIAFTDNCSIKPGNTINIYI